MRSDRRQFEVNQIDGGGDVSTAGEASNANKTLIKVALREKKGKKDG
jgi:hypothetical protein